MSTSQTILQGIPTFSASKNPAPTLESKPGNNTFNQILKNEVGSKIKRAPAEQQKTSPIQQKELKDTPATKNTANSATKDTAQETSKNAAAVASSNAANNTNANTVSNAGTNSTGIEAPTRKQSNELEAKEDAHQKEKSEHEQLANDDLNDPSSLLVFVGNINAFAFSTAQNKSSEQVETENNTAFGKVDSSEINTNARLNSQVTGEQTLNLPNSSAPPQNSTTAMQMSTSVWSPTTPTPSTANDTNASIDSRIKSDTSPSILLDNKQLTIPNQGLQTNTQNKAIDANGSNQTISAVGTIKTDAKIDINLGQKSDTVNQNLTNNAAPPRLTPEDSQLIAETRTNAQRANDESSTLSAQATQTSTSVPDDKQNSKLASTVGSGQIPTDKSSVSTQGLGVANTLLNDSASKSNVRIQNVPVESRNAAPVTSDNQANPFKSILDQQTSPVGTTEKSELTAEVLGAKSLIESTAVEAAKNKNSKSTAELTHDGIVDRNKLDTAAKSSSANEQIKSPPVNVIIENQASTLERSSTNANANMSADISTNNSSGMGTVKRAEQTVDTSIANENIKFTSADIQNSLVTLSTKSIQGEIEGAKAHNAATSETLLTDNKSVASNTVSNLAPAPSPIDITKTTTLDHISPRVGTKGWDQAIGQKIVWMVAGGEQSAQLTLNPPDLGPVQVVLSISDHFVDASFVSSHLDVREAIEAAAPKLREMMDSAGISLSGFSVSADSSQSGNAYSEAKAQANTRNVAQSEFARTGEKETVAIPVSNRNQGRELGLVDTFV